LYKLTEKVLEASAASYERAKYTWKKEQVLKLLEKARRDRQLAISLTEALHAPDFTSTAAGFVTPSPTHETAAGLNRFEHADVQTTLVVQRRDLLVGDNLDCDIELVNAGRESAQLAMMDQVVPRGFELVSFPERCRREDGCINLRGRRLEALGTEDVKIILKPTVKGMFTLKPRITYLDETGSYRTSEPEPVKVTVNEIGISGWLKGPDTRR
jgi:hypothetical protein